MKNALRTLKQRDIFSLLAVSKCVLSCAKSTFIHQKPSKKPTRTMADEFVVFNDASFRGYHAYFKDATVVIGEVLICENRVFELHVSDEEKTSPKDYIRKNSRVYI